MAFYHERAAFYHEKKDRFWPFYQISSFSIETTFELDSSLKITFKLVFSPKIRHEMGSSRVITFEMDWGCFHPHPGMKWTGDVLKTKEIFFEALKEHNVSFIEVDILNDVLSRSEGIVGLGGFFSFSDFSFDEMSPVFVMILLVGMNAVFCVVVSIVLCCKIGDKKNAGLRSSFVCEKLERIESKDVKVKIALERLERSVNNLNFAASNTKLNSHFNSHENLSFCTAGQRTLPNTRYCSTQSVFDTSLVVPEMNKFSRSQPILTEPIFPQPIPSVPVTRNGSLDSSGFSS